MITLKQARNLVQERSGYNVVSAGDCGDKWAFGFKEFKDRLGGLVALVDKKNGACEYLSSAEFVNLMLDGEITCTPIDLPKETP